MFKVGDKLIYPIYGVCILEAVEDRVISGEKMTCYFLNIPQAKMWVTIPVDKAIELGIRKLVKIEILEKILSRLNLGETDPVLFKNQRYCSEMNKKKIKTGDIYKGTEIIRDLTRKARRIKLGAVDENMLNNARQIFLGEMMEVKGVAQEQAVHLLDEALGLGKNAVVPI